MLPAFISWWYGEGWARQVSQARERMLGIFDLFSLDLLLKTFFSPFRQISSGKIEGSLNNQVQIIIDKLVSRMIGAMIRSVVLFVGVLAIILTAIYSVLKLAAWPVMPAIVFVGLLLAASGWTPW